MGVADVGGVQRGGGRMPQVPSRLRAEGSGTVGESQAAWSGREHSLLSRVLEYEPCLLGIILC